MDFPTPVIAHMAAFLDAPDLHSFQLTSKRLHNICVPVWQHRASALRFNNNNELLLSPPSTRVLFFDHAQRTSEKFEDQALLGNPPRLQNLAKPTRFEDCCSSFFVLVSRFRDGIPYSSGDAECVQAFFTNSHWSSSSSHSVDLQGVPVTFGPNVGNRSWDTVSLTVLEIYGGCYYRLLVAGIFLRPQDRLFPGHQGSFVTAVLRPACVNGSRYDTRESSLSLQRLDANNDREDNEDPWTWSGFRLGELFLRDEENYMLEVREEEALVDEREEYFSNYVDDMFQNGKRLRKHGG